MRNLFLSSVLLLLLLAMSVNAQDNYPALIGGDLGLFSKYVWRGTAFDDQPVLQPDLWMSVKGVTMVFWGNMSLTDQDDEFEGQFNEWDVYITFPVKTVGKVNFSGELDYLSFPSTSWASGFGTSEIAAHASIDITGSPILSLFWDIWQFHGLYSRLNLSQALKMGPGNLLLAGDIGWGNEKHNSQFGVPEAGGLLHINADIRYTYDLSGQFTLTPGVHISSILQKDIRNDLDAVDVSATNLFFSLNMAWTVSQ